MTTVIIVGEGLTEETFVVQVLAPALSAELIWLEPRNMDGGLRYQRVTRFLRNTLRERNDTYVTTFFDLYALSNEFPGMEETIHEPDPLRKVETIEKRFTEAIVEIAEIQRPERFFAHVQPYEFEALLFADVANFVGMEPAWIGYANNLGAIRESYLTPEHINDGPTTHPSARLGVLQNPSYNKILHGPIGADLITLAKIEQECPHFAAWLQKLRTLPPLP